MMLEDNDDLAGNGGFLGPWSGGQNFDAEVLAAAVQGSDLHILIVSGQRPDNGLKFYAPGDLRIMTTGGDFAVEIGGGVGGGSGTLLSGGAAGSTYTLDGDGNTVSHSAAAGAQTAGSVWMNPTWLPNTFLPPTQTQMQLTGGTHVGDALYRFTRNTVTTQHSIIEMAIPLSVFGGATIDSILWYPSCGNDELILDVNLVPEPGTWALALVAAAGVVPVVRSRRKRR
jgi:hypothetical protein